MSSEMDRQYWQHVPAPSYNYTYHNYPSPSYPPAPAASNIHSRQQQEHEYEQPQSYVYSVKLINPKRKSDYVVRLWHDAKQVFISVDGIKQKLMDSFPNELHHDNFALGFYSPPSSTKRWIVDNCDLKAMYNSFEPGSKINLWCETNTDVETVEDSEPPAKKRHTSRESTEEEIDIILKKLKDKHPDKGSPPLRLWAKLIHNGRWDSYDSPPPIPLITGEQKGAKPKSDKVADALTGVANALAKALQPASPASPAVTEVKDSDQMSTKISPMKTATLRRSCLEDLKRLKDLLEEGVLTSEEFANEKRHIIDTLKSLK